MGNKPLAASAVLLPPIVPLAAVMKCQLGAGLTSGLWVQPKVRFFFQSNWGTVLGSLTPPLKRVDQTPCSHYEVLSFRFALSSLIQKFDSGAGSVRFAWLQSESDWSCARMRIRVCAVTKRNINESDLLTSGRCTSQIEIAILAIRN